MERGRRGVPVLREFRVEIPDVARVVRIDAHVVTLEHVALSGHDLFDGPADQFFAARRRDRAVQFQHLDPALAEAGADVVSVDVSGYDGLDALIGKDSADRAAYVRRPVEPRPDQGRRRRDVE